MDIQFMYIYIYIRKGLIGLIVKFEKLPGLTSNLTALIKVKSKGWTFGTSEWGGEGEIVALFDEEAGAGDVSSLFGFSISFVWEN